MSMKDIENLPVGDSEYEADNCIGISGSSYQEISVSPTPGNDYFDNNI